MSAIQFPIFIIGDRVLYRGYFIDIVDTNHISISRMDNPYTSKNYYTLQSRKPLNLYSTYQCYEQWYEQALDYIDNLMIE